MAQQYTVHRCKKNGAAEKKVYMTLTVHSVEEIREVCAELTQEKGREYTYCEYFE